MSQNRFEKVNLYGKVAKKNGENQAIKGSKLHVNQPTFKINGHKNNEIGI